MTILDNLEKLLLIIEHHVRDNVYTMETINDLHSELLKCDCDFLFSDLEDVINEAKEEGYINGREDGYEDGYSTGREIGYQEGYECQNN